HAAIARCVIDFLLLAPIALTSVLEREDRARDDRACISRKQPALQERLPFRACEPYSVRKLGMTLLPLVDPLPMNAEIGRSSGERKTLRHKLQNLFAVLRLVICGPPDIRHRQ